MPEPLAESFVATWSPTLRYHQHRLDVLASLEAEGLLAQFRVGEDDIGARTGSTEVSLRNSGTDLHTRIGLMSAEATQILRSVFVSVSPPEYEFSLLYQFLTPITDESYDAARLSALNRFDGGFLCDLGVVDFAMLIDGRRSDVEWHCEFGIISRDEVEMRLRRQVGRIGVRGGAPISTEPTDDTEVAFFADFAWHPSERVAPNDGEIVDDLAQQIQTLRAEAVDIVSALHARVCEGSVQTVAGGLDL